MAESTKYATLKERGATALEVWREAEADGLSDIACIRIVREVFGLTLVEAKAILIEVRSGIGLDEHQARLVEALDGALSSDDARSSDSGSFIDLGCFRELGYEDGPSLAAARQPEPWPEQARVVTYLRAGEMVTFCPGFEEDIFEKGTESGNSGMRTDGVYRWPDVLAYYVERYNVHLPEGAVDHMRANGWTPARARPTTRPK